MGVRQFISRRFPGQTRMGTAAASQLGLVAIALLGTWTVVAAQAYARAVPALAPNTALTLNPCPIPACNANRVVIQSVLSDKGQSGVLYKILGDQTHLLKLSKFGQPGGDVAPGNANLQEEVGLEVTLAGLGIRATQNAHFVGVECAVGCPPGFPDGVRGLIKQRLDGFDLETLLKVMGIPGTGGPLDDATKLKIKQIQGVRWRIGAPVRWLMKVPSRRDKLIAAIVPQLRCLFYKIARGLTRAANKVRIEDIKSANLFWTTQNQLYVVDAMEMPDGVPAGQEQQTWQHLVGFWGMAGGFQCNGPCKWPDVLADLPDDVNVAAARAGQAPCN